MSMYIRKYWSVEAHSLFHTTRGDEFMAMESLAFSATVTTLVTMILRYCDYACDYDSLVL